MAVVEIKNFLPILFTCSTSQERPVPLERLNNAKEALIKQLSVQGARPLLRY